MIGLTLVFHIFSAVCIVALVYWIVRLQRQVQFSQTLWQGAIPGANQRVYVDWPSKFLQGFCLVLGCKFSDQSKASKPSRIDQQAWVKFHLSFGILAVKIGEDNKITVFTGHEVKNKKQESQKLIESMHGNVTVEFSSARA